MDNIKRKRRNATTSLGVPPNTDGLSYRVRLANDEIEWLTKKSGNENVTRSAIIRKAIRNMMQEDRDGHD